MSGFASCYEGKFRLLPQARHWSNIVHTLCLLLLAASAGAGVALLGVYIGDRLA
jgi:hypothetical protein